MVPRKTIVLLTIVIFASVLFSQESEDITLLQKGSKAIQFQIDGLAELSAFEGSVLSFKQNFSSAKGFRVGLTINGNSRNNDREQFRHWEDGDYTVDLSEKTTTWDAIMSTQFVSYHDTKHPDFLLYWGLGPTFGYGERINKKVIDDPENGIFQTSKSNQKTYSVGASASLGFEWFWCENISLVAEYYSNYLYSLGNEKRDLSSVEQTMIATIDESSDLTLKQFRSTVKLGLSIYF